MKNDTPQARQNLVAVAMVFVLAGATGLAWMTTGKPKAHVYTGADMLAKLASQKIDKYWSSEESTRCMIGLAGKPDKAVGWEITSIQSDAGGEFSGLESGGSKDSLHAVRWTLSPDLSQGTYSAIVYGKNGNEISQTETTLTEDRVNIVRRVQQVELTGSSPRPKNYVPEGALPLVLGIVAETGNEITVKMVFDEIAIVGGSIRFVDVELSPLRSGAVRVRPLGRQVRNLIDYYIDSENRISRYEYPGTTLFYRLCKKETIAELFGTDGEAPAMKAKP
jgi:hypothetical protein